MTMRLARADRLKIRRTWMSPLTLLGPLAVTALVVIDYLLRQEYMAEAVTDTDGWTVLMNEVGMIQVAAMMLGICLLVSMAFDVDHRASAWKQLLALPVSRIGVYVSKLLLVSGLMLAACVLMAIGVTAIWTWQDYGAIPWEDLGRLVAISWVSVLPVLGIQALLSAHVRNQAVAITIGVAGSVMALFGSDLAEWLPWALPANAVRFASGGVGEPWAIVGTSVAWAVGALVVGAVSFARRDVV